MENLVTFIAAFGLFFAVVLWLSEPKDTDE